MAQYRDKMRCKKFFNAAITLQGEQSKIRRRPFFFFLNKHTYDSKAEQINNLYLSDRFHFPLKMLLFLQK